MVCAWIAAWASSFIDALSTFNLINYLMILILMTKLSPIKQLRTANCFIGFNNIPCWFECRTNSAMSIKNLTNCFVVIVAWPATTNARMRGVIVNWNLNWYFFQCYPNVVDKFHHAGVTLKLIINNVTHNAVNFILSWWLYVLLIVFGNAFWLMERRIKNYAVPWTAS